MARFMRRRRPRGSATKPAPAEPDPIEQAILEDEQQAADEERRVARLWARWMRPLSACGLIAFLLMVAGFEYDLPVLMIVAGPASAVINAVAAYAIHKARIVALSGTGPVIGAAFCLGLTLVSALNVIFAVIDELS